MISCLACGTIAEKVWVKTDGTYWQCDCYSVEAVPDEDGNPSLFDTPKFWVNIEQAANFYRQAQQHAAAHGLTVGEWAERASGALVMVMNGTVRISGDGE